jgi:hypothetical protein
VLRLPAGLAQLEAEELDAGDGGKFGQGREGDGAEEVVGVFGAAGPGEADFQSRGGET